MKRLTRNKHVFVLEPGATPAITIASGEELIVETWDAFEGLRDPRQIQEKGMEPYDAYSLLSLAGDIRVSRAFRPISPVKIMLSRRVLEQIG